MALFTKTTITIVTAASTHSNLPFTLNRECPHLHSHARNLKPRPLLSHHHGLTKPRPFIPKAAPPLYTATISPPTTKSNTTCKFTIQIIHLKPAIKQSQNPEAIAASIPSSSAPPHLQCCASSRPPETRVSLLSPIVVADAAEPSHVKAAQTCEAHCCNNPAFPHQAVHLLTANRFDANSPVADALPSPCSHLPHSLPAKE
ncbi:hypothetical protein M0R45_016340 [Rubus argutus]|uniref:Uncharacterized protein n=1 Tax=Rubus argutus TaxID=59490 RepID=A0AAW1XS96_RUBAR